MDIFSFLRTLEQGRISPVYLFVGAEALLIDEALAALAARLFPDPGLRDLNRQLFRGGDDPAEPILEAVQALPLLAERRLVIVKDADRLPAKEGERLVQYVNRPNPSTCLVFVAETADQRRPLFRAIPEPAVVEARPLGRALPAWLRRRAKEAGADLAPEAANLLVELAGEETAIVAGELEKAILYAGGGRVGQEEIRAVLGVERSRSIFELTNSLVRRDAATGVRVVEKLLAEGEEPLGLLGMVIRELRFLWQIKRWTAAGKPQDEIARLSRRPPAVLEGALARAQATSITELRWGVQRCWEVEGGLKTGTPSPRGELELLVYELCRGA